MTVAAFYLVFFMSRSNAGGPAVIPMPDRETCEARLLDIKQNSEKLFDWGYCVSTQLRVDGKK